MTRFQSITPNLLVFDVRKSTEFCRFYGMREFAVTDTDGHITFAERVKTD